MGNEITMAKPSFPMLVSSSLRKPPLSTVEASCGRKARRAALRFDRRKDRRLSVRSKPSKRNPKAWSKSVCQCYACRGPVSTVRKGSIFETAPSHAAVAASHPFDVRQQERHRHASAYNGCSAAA